jgi:hypothetical protein
MSAQVMAHPLNTTWQSLFTFLSWGIVILMLGIALRMGLKQKTPFFVIAIFAAGIAALAEPLYDVTFDLWFYNAHHNGSPGAMWSTFTSFGVIQPNWTHSGYIILYAMAPLYLGRLMYEGRLSKKAFLIAWGAEMLASVVFEVIGTGTNVYTYYGPYVLRIWHYPLVIGVLEGTQTILFTVLAVNLWRRINSKWGLTAIIAAFPVTMFGANAGLGWPVIIALHASHPTFSTALVWIGTLLSMFFCVVAVNGASLFLPKPPVTDAPDVPAVDPQTVGVPIPA